MGQRKKADWSYVSRLWVAVSLECCKRMTLVGGNNLPIITADMYGLGEV
jgi:hypothetical protein